MKAKLQDTSKYEEESEDEIGIQIMFERTEHEPKVIKELHLEISLSKKHHHIIIIKMMIQLDIYLNCPLIILA